MDWDKIFQRRERIAERVHLLMDDLTQDLSPDEDEVVRNYLTETFRFWRT